MTKESEDAEFYKLDPQWMSPPMVYFGGKRLIASDIWQRLGDPHSFVDPFCGTCSILLARPTPPRLETVNDVDGFLVNVFRSIRYDPDAVATYADQPVHECTKHAIHTWLVNRRDSLVAKLEADPEYHDPKLAGWWLFGKACHIGSGWCGGEGPWHSIDGQLLNEKDGPNGRGVNRSLPHLAGSGQGVNRSLPQIPDRGVNTAANISAMKTWFRALSARFRRVRITCGDWTRVLGPSITTGNGIAAVVLDPPYYGIEQYYAAISPNIAKDVEKWAIENGEHEDMRIAVCGYEGDYNFPATWECMAWAAAGGYGLQRKDGKNDNNRRERIWFSPNCLKPELDLFG